MTTLAVYDTPHLPEGWHGCNVIRIVDALGKSIAWIDPALAGSCIAFCARSGTGKPWFTVLDSEPPWALDESGTLGCDVLWTNTTHSPVPVRCLVATWDFLDRDPTQVRVSGIIGSEKIEVTSRCEDGALTLSITRARGQSRQIRAGFRLHLQNMGRNDPTILPGGPNEVTVRSPRSPFEALVCRSSLPMDTYHEAADGRASTARIDIMNLDEPVHEDGMPEVLAELELVPLFGD